MATNFIDKDLLNLGSARSEPVDLVRTLNSHGFVDLPPMRPAD